MAGVAAAACLTALAGRVGGAGPAPIAGPLALQAQPQALGTLPVVAEHRYRIAAKIRPLLLFWIGKDDVGGARIRWRKGDGDARGCDALIGSDPARAPRKINRWGFISEETGPAGARIVGIMKSGDEQTLDEATSRVAAEAKGSVVFKMIDSAVSQTEAVSRVTVSTVPRDYSYREFDAIVDILMKETAPPKIQKTPVPPGGRTGLLSAITELLHDGVESVKRVGKAPGRKGLGYVYYAKQYRPHPRVVQHRAERHLRRRRVSFAAQVRLPGARASRVVERELHHRLRPRRPAGRDTGVPDVPAPMVVQGRDGARRAPGVLSGVL